MERIRHAFMPLALLAFLNVLIPIARAQTTTITSTTVGNAGHLQFNLSYNSDIDQNALLGFEKAANRWSNIFSDPIIVNIQIGFDSLPANVIGSTGTAGISYSYADTRNALVLDSKSADDLTAVANLPTGTSTQFLVNYTTQNGDSATPYLDNNGNFDNLNIGMTVANAKALGLFQDQNELDASITFTSDSTNFHFDFNPDDGITAGEYDFVGAATHEIGHALGFISTADDVDRGTSGIRDTQGNLVFPVYDETTFDPDTLDLYRYSTESTAQGGFDITVDTRTKYFSLDGGLTQVSSNSIFSDGKYSGDGQQASHWKDNLGAGIMDPTAAPGELLQISSNDVRLFDVIGYDLVPAPEPSSLLVLVLGSLGTVGCIIVRRMVLWQTRQTSLLNQ